MWNLLVDYFIWSHDEKSHVAPHFNHLEPRNAMVPLTTLFSSCGNGVSDQKVMLHIILIVIDLRL